MTQDEIKRALDSIAGAAMCHQQLLVAIVASLPDGAKVALQFEAMSQEGLEQLQARKAPDDYLKAYQDARNGLLYNLQEVLAQVEAHRAKQH